MFQVYLMKFHDVHCHLPKNFFYRDIEDHMKNWLKEGLELVVSVSTKYKESLRSVELHSRFNQIIPGIGIHPWGAKRELTNEVKNNFETLVIENQNIVIGEIGLDYHFIDNEEYYPIQEDYFNFFLELSEKHKKPVNIHGKGAERIASEILTSYQISSDNVLMHWYSGPREILQTYIDRGYFLSINPSILSGSSHIAVLEVTPLEQILTESDGNVKYTINNERVVGTPAIIPKVIEKISDSKKTRLDEISIILQNNLKRYLNTV